MSWQVWALSNWKSAGGQITHDLGPAFKGSTIRAEVGARGTATLVLDAEIAWALAAKRRIVGVQLPDGGWHEFRVTSRTRGTTDVGALITTVTAEPRVFDLSDSDLVREFVGGRWLYRFTNSLTIADAWARWVAPRLATDGLAGLALGVVHTDRAIPLTINRWTYGELVAGWLEGTGLELQWRRSADGMTEYLDFLERVGDEAPVYALALGDPLTDHVIAEDTTELFTVARVAGLQVTPESEAATIGEASWRVDSVRVLPGSLVAVALRERGGTRSPVVADGQYAPHLDLGLPGRYLQFADGVTRVPILDAFAATGEVVVTSAPPSGDAFVQIVADERGTPLEQLEIPAAVREYGLVVGDVAVPTGRGERQYLRNGGHEQGLEGWSPVNSGAAEEIRRAELGITVTAQADGARAAGVSTATPFAVRGLVPNIGRVIRGDELRVGGVTLPITADAIPAPDGSIELALGAPGLPGNFPDNHPFQLQRREVRTLTLDGAQSPLAPTLRFRDVNTDGLTASSFGSLTSTDDVYVNQPGSQAAFSGYTDAPRLAGRALIEITGAANRSALNWATYSDDVYVLAGVSLSYTFGESTGTATFGSAPIAPIVGTRLRYFASTGRFEVLRVTAIAGGVLSIETENGAPIVSGSGLGVFEACNVLLADGSTWTYTVPRETRTMYCDGAVSAAALSLPCKPQANLATRHWVATDTIAMDRALMGLFDLTSVSSPVLVTVYDEALEVEVPVGWEITATFAAATSTMDDVAPGDWAGVDVVFQNGASSTWRLSSIVGTTATFVRGLTTAAIVELALGLASATWVKRDTYALTGTAAWGTNGRVVLALASAIPAGRSYARGLPVLANWGSGFLRLHEDASGGDDSVELFGADAFTATSNPAADLRGALYRVVASGSTMPIPGDTLYAESTVTADALGEALVPLSAANTNAIADGATITITRPSLVAATEPPLGSVLRLFCPAGGTTGEPSSSTAGWSHELARFTVPDGTTRQITALSVFGLSVADWMTPNAPVVAIVNADGNVLGWSALGDDGILVEAAPGVVLLTTRAIIAASGTYTVRVYGGHPTDYRLWCAHVHTMLYQGEALDAPYTATDHAAPMMLLGLKALVEGAQPRATDRITVQEFSDAVARARGVPAATLPRITLGGDVVLLASGRRMRVRAYTLSPTDAFQDVELGMVPPNGARLLGATALAANTRSPR